MIERIKIENFKSIRKLDLELKPINILIGANGAGKSNFLSFFELYATLFFGNLEYYIGNNVDKFLHFGRKKSQSMYGLMDIENTDAIYASIIPSKLNNSGQIREIGVYHNSKNQGKDYYKWELLHKETNPVSGSLCDVEGPSEKNIFEYLDYLQIFHFNDTGKGSPLKRVCDLNDNRYLRADGANLASYLFYLREKHPKDFKKIELHIRSVAPFFERFDLEPDRRNERQIELRWFEKGSDDYFNAFDLSDGTLRFIALTTLLMQSELPKVIIIDEPELGLHPFAITKLAAFIRQAAVRGSQVIISTQSIEFINHFNPEDIIVADRKSDNYNHQQEESVFHRLNSEDLKDWLESYSIGEIWEKNIIGGRP